MLYKESEERAPEQLPQPDAFERIVREGVMLVSALCVKAGHEVAIIHQIVPFCNHMQLRSTSFVFVWERTVRSMGVVSIFFIFFFFFLASQQVASIVPFMLLDTYINTSALYCVSSADTHERTDYTVLDQSNMSRT